MARLRLHVLPSTTIVLLCCISFLRAAADDPATLAARLQSAQQHSSLDDAALKPWHLKLSVHLFDSKGSPAGDGTIEEWWISPGHDRREYDTPVFKSTEIRDGDKEYRTRDVGSPPYLLSLLLEQVVDPTAEYKKEDSSHAELRRTNFGKVPLDCIMLSQPIKRLAFAPLGLFPTYCFDPGKDVLRASIEFGNQAILMNRVGTFQGRNVATNVAIMSDSAPLARAEVVVLQTVPSEVPGPALSATDDMTAQNLERVPVSTGVIAGMLLSQVQPQYPEYARSNRIDGTVVMRAVIGTDGHVHSLRIISAPDPTLAVSAVDAVRRWTYKPYVLKGMAVDVDTTINVNYKLQ